MLTKEQNELLTQTDAGTPMGGLFRRYWMPAIPSERVPAPGGKPVAVKLLGEKLVAYRDVDGKVSIMEAQCPHRGASLVLARNEKTDSDCHLTCIYHGWKIAGNGEVLETPPEPANSQFARSVKHVAYPTEERAGVVWIYMGPKDKQPPFPDYQFANRPQEEVWSMIARNPCNYLQGLENTIEAVHAPYLHWSREEFERQKDGPLHYRFLIDPRPKQAAQPAPWGMQTVNRFEIDEKEGKSLFWLRPVILPSFTIITFPFDTVRWSAAMCWVPIDDHNYYVWTFIWDAEGGPLTQEFREAIETQQVYKFIDPDNDYLSNQLVNGEWIQHRDWMESGESFSGFEGVNTQDLAVQHSMGPILDRTKEHLATEDMIIVQVRNFLLRSLAQFQKGIEPLPGLEPGISLAEVDSRALITDSSVSTDDVLRNREWSGVVENV